jgi:hypothetical protein
MNQFNNAWLERRQREFMRPDAHRYIRPDAWRFMPLGAPRWEGKDSVRYFWPHAPNISTESALTARDNSDPEAERRTLLRLKRGLSAIAAEFRVRRDLRAFKAGFNPGQLRDDIGRWSDSGSAEADDNRDEELVQLAQFGGVLDFDGQFYYRPGGHHEMPEKVYKEWQLDPETKRIFRQSSTGELGVTIRMTPDGLHPVSLTPA